ncbi:cytochrome P450 94B3-like [Ananas comosus]|uniref:Cytochrome P450 94B3-like n=1 Tax=Ananas comosus TaxID=4615 RepID=A0A6P5HM12_ANACO|nr:cytochrome P450 94B3-like [Ananas comosus]
MNTIKPQSNPMELSLLQSIFFLLLLLALFLLALFLLRQNPSKTPSTIHGLKPHPLLGHLPHFLSNRHRILDWFTETLLRSPTHTISLRILGGSAAAVVTADPRNVEHMLRARFDNYPKGAHSASMLHDLLGGGIFNSDGDPWRRQRKAASFEFSRRSLRAFVVDAVQSELAERLLPLLEKAEEDGDVVDLQKVLERFSFDNICKVAFGEDPGCLSAEGFAGRNFEFMQAFEEAQNIVIGRFMSPLRVAWRVKKLFDVGSERRLRKLMATVHGYTAEIAVRARREGTGASSEQKRDLLSRFASDETHSEEFLRDVVTNFLLAGRETTSSALTWFFWLVSARPDVQRKIVDELRSVRAAAVDRMLGFDELREMHYLHAAITESMRLYPPVPMDTQSCREDDVMPDGTFVGKGWQVSYSAYAMGRLPDIWGPDCEEYRPERWLEDGVFRPESPFKYPVFHAGPRMCLGKEMAYIQMKSIVASVLERYQFQVVGKDGSPESILSFTLRMKGGLPVRFQKRDE